MRKVSAKQEFKELYSRYLKKYLIKIALISAVISSSILLALSLVFWIIGFKYYWIAFIVFGVSYVISFIALFLANKPSEKDFYASIEELGLAQRAITMYEYMDDDSLIAKLQRENAKASIRSQDSKALKITASLALGVTAGVIFGLSAGTSVAAGLSANKIIPSAVEAVANAQEETKEFEVVFETVGDGYIDGDILQIVKEGEDAFGVYAVPEYGWYFYSWGTYDEKYETIVTDDLNKNPEDHDTYREVKNVTENITYYAVFKPLDETTNQEEDPDDKEPRRPEDEKPQRPKEGKEEQYGSGSGENSGAGG